MSASVLADFLLRMDFGKAAKSIESFISEAVRESRRRGVVIGMSGGVDSSTVATLAVRALGPERVEGLILPSKQTKREDIEDARSIAERLGIRYRSIEISTIVDAVLSAYGPENVRSRVARGNISPRVRMTLLYLHANESDLLVAGTGNRSELLIGYFTKYGDGGVDILPIGDLYKTQVRGLARYLNIPGQIIDKVPTAGLWEGQTDEGEIGMSYVELDTILSALFDMNMQAEEITRRFGLPEQKVRRVIEMSKYNEHKLRMPPSPRVREPRND
ncbi:MAG: NAD+ synthase [Aigarchaeota archaeon]|nr:NAD+ synthase [Aigarchaeota archaeon]MDW8092612.1 NAD+ synthase [Nitrososphaerota archaeon]